MKRYMIILLLFIITFGIRYAYSQSGENNKEDIAEENSNTVKAINSTAWKTDSDTILSIITNLRNYKESSDDSTLKTKQKQNTLKRELFKINKDYHNKPLSLKAIIIEDVTAEKDLSDYGKRRAKEILRKIKKDPSSAMFIGDGNLENNPLLVFTLAIHLALCEKCYKETGRYEVKCKIPVPDETGYSQFRTGIKAGNSLSDDNDKIDAEIILILQSEKKALDYSKGSIIPISGKIKSIVYKGSQFFESVTIRIE